MADAGPREYWEKKLGEDFSLRSVGASYLGRHYNQWLYRVRRRSFLRSVRGLPLDFPHLRVLDVGSGTGFYVDLWRGLGAEKIVGCDLTAAAVRGLSLKFPHLQFYQVDIAGELGELWQQEFDVVSAFDVLFHILSEDRFERAIANISSVLRPAGLFLFSDHFVHGGCVRRGNTIARPLTTVVEVLRRWNLETIDRLPIFRFMNAPVDSSNPLRWALWRRLELLVSRSEALGTLAGACLYPLEVATMPFSREGPSTEMMICRKEPASAGGSGDALGRGP